MPVRIDLNKSVPPWRRKSWKKRYSHAMRMQNQAKLVQQHDEVVESSKTGCRNLSRAHGKAFEVATISRLLKIIGLFCKRDL